MGSWAIFVWIGAGALSAAGLALAGWALLADRSRGRKRCPRCWYDLGHILAAPGVCSECGRRVRRLRALYRTRRRWRRATAGVLLLLIGAAGLAIPWVVGRGPEATLPGPLLTAMLPLLEDEESVGLARLGRRATSGAWWPGERWLAARHAGEVLAAPALAPGSTIDREQVAGAILRATGPGARGAVGPLRRGLGTGQAEDIARQIALVGAPLAPLEADLLALVGPGGSASEQWALTAALSVAPRSPAVRGRIVGAIEPVSAHRDLILALAQNSRGPADCLMPTLLDALRGSSQQERDIAVRAFIAIGPRSEDALRGLAEALDHDPFVANMAAWALRSYRALDDPPPATISRAFADELESVQDLIRRRIRGGG